LPDFEALKCPGEFETLSGVRTYAWRNGHLPGSCSYSFKTQSGRVGMILGDWCNFDQPIVRGMPSVNEFPEDWIPDELWGTDQTYSSAGFDQRVSIFDEGERMGREVRDHVLAGK